MNALSLLPRLARHALVLTAWAGALALSACGGGGSDGGGGSAVTLTVNRSVAEGGMVVSSPAGIDCGATCSTTLSAGTRVTLTATPAAGYDFSGWSGSSSVNCAGTGPCTFTLDSAQTVTATFTRQSAVQRALHVVVAGSGSVLSSPAGIAGCTSDCTANFATGTAVTLTATPASGQTLSGWSGGGCTGTGATCTVTLSADTTVTATFAPVTTPQTLGVTLAGAGSGSVASTPAGIDCGSTCSATFAQDSTVTLTATPQSGSAFGGWSGACTGTGACTVTMSTARAVTATFDVTAPSTYALNVALSGTGSGAVSSSPAGITCGTTCSTTYTAGTSVTLTAAAATGSTFTGWSGACSGTAATCTVPMNAAATVGAAFTRNTAVLTVTKTGTGTVSSSPAGIACGATCSAAFDQGTAVTLTAAAGTGYAFSGWSGGCTGTAATCTVTLNAAATVNATFTQIQRSLSVTTTTGGSVASSPAGITCANGATCSANFADGTSVTLAAAPMSGYTFSGWSGACTGTGACTLTMSAARSVTATFAVTAPTTYSLNVVAATGGTVTSSPTGIACGATCTATYNAGTAVTLTATPQTGYTFSGWSGGGCTGTGTCAVTLNANTTVSAAFSAINHVLTVTKAGTGSGTVTSSPAGVSCGSTCAGSYLQGTSVTLTAAAATGSAFTGWSGACTGSAATCTVSMSAARSVTATFTLSDTTRPTLSSTSPSAGATGVSTTGALTATFSEALACATVTTSSFSVSTAAGAVAGTVSCSGSTATFTPAAALAASTVHTATLGVGITDTAGNALASAQTWSFTTGAAATGRAWFVSNSGSDSAAGTLAAPLRTISRAINLVGPGETIEVRAGTYTENLYPRTAGTAAAWITLRGYNGERPVVRSTGAGPTIYFYRDECNEAVIGSGSGNTDCLPMYWVISGLEVQGSPNGGSDGNVIKVDTPKVKITGNRLCCAVADVLKLVRTANDVEISDNEIWQDGAIVTPGANAQGIDIVGADRPIVRGNYLHDIPDIAVYAKGNSRNPLFENNLLYNIGGSNNGHALMLGQSTDASRVVDGVYETYDGIVRNNVVINATWACVATSSSTRVKIHNNSCYNTGTTVHGSILLSNESELGTQGLDIEIYNNIIHGSANNPVIKISSSAMSDYSTLKIDKNLYYIGGGDPKFTSSDHFNNVGLTTWRTRYTTLSGRTDSSLSANPLFAVTTPGSTALTLQATSPAINAGLSLPTTVPTDRRGVARPQNGSTDIGAYEY